MHTSIENSGNTPHDETETRAMFKVIEETYGSDLTPQQIQDDNELGTIYEHLGQERQYRVTFALWLKGMRHSMPSMRDNNAFLAASCFRRFHSLLEGLAETDPERAEELGIIEDFIGYEIDRVRKPGVLETEPVPSAPGSRAGNLFLATAIKYSRG